MEIEPEPYYRTVQDFIEDLQDHSIELDNENTITKKTGVWKTYNEFKAAIEETYNIDYYNTEVCYEDDDGLEKKISNEKDYFEAVKCIDCLRFYLVVKFDKAKVKKARAPEPDLNAPIRTTPWACTRCQARNGPENLKCKVCNQQRKN
jgi:hypothetical protein